MTILVLTVAMGFAPLPADPGWRSSARPAQADSICSTPAHRQFDFWIGAWDVLNRNRPANRGTWFDTGRATDRVYAVAGGCGIVEHWRGHAYGQFIVGFSIRAYNPRTAAWDLMLLWPGAAPQRFTTLTGGFRHGRGEFFSHSTSPQGDSVLTRFTFSDIGPTSLRWENGTSTDGGRSWQSNWIMEFHRRDPVAEGPLLNGPTISTSRCPGPPYRAFDFLIGEWEGVRRGTASDSSAELPAHLRVVPILEGCATIELVSAGDTPTAWQGYRVRAFEPDENRWVEYQIDSSTGALVRLEAAEGGGPWVFEGRDADGARLRSVLEHAADGSIQRRVQRSADDGRTWRNLYTLRFSGRTQ